ncbi:hypothetical protein Pmani_010508 [Petrolisthes manimaculis]|uniref:Uncharacterized protein n=1 Tax=Petrolisthes manimaculis TaxID=1843537 RepID=A0AAE1Q1F6_9EUCA|nr:hypothetical protein Pmani_010508 [Petrolisthes manimaculis]
MSRTERRSLASRSDTREQATHSHTQSGQATTTTTTNSEVLAWVTGLLVDGCYSYYWFDHYTTLHCLFLW